jgi:hypothetical protein
MYRPPACLRLSDERGNKESYWSGLNNVQRMHTKDTEKVGQGQKVTCYYKIPALVLAFVKVLAGLDVIFELGIIILGRIAPRSIVWMNFRGLEIAFDW